MGGAIYRGKWVYKIVQPLMDKYGLNIDVAARGVADEVAQNNKRSLRWKIDFFIIGFKMIKFGICVFMYRIFKNKCFK